MATHFWKEKKSEKFCSVCFTFLYRKMSEYFKEYVQIFKIQYWNVTFALFLPLKFWPEWSMQTSTGQLEEVINVIIRLSDSLHLLLPFHYAHKTSIKRS